MQPIDSISFSRTDDSISAIVLNKNFVGYEFIYDEILQRITEAFLVDATGIKPVHTVISLNDAPTYLLIKVRKMIEINYHIHNDQHSIHVSKV